MKPRNYKKRTRIERPQPRRAAKLAASAEPARDLIWTRLDDPAKPPYAYEMEGELGPEVRWVKIVTRRTQDEDFDETITFIKRKAAAVALIQNAIADGFARAYQYKLVESNAPAGHQMTEEKKALLRQAREKRRSENAAE
jgi:hypothetical protein